jgi:hypothetical protein
MDKGFLFNGAEVNPQLDGAKIANNNIDGTKPQRLIYNPNNVSHLSKLYKNGYLKEIGGSCDIKVTVSNNNKLDRIRTHVFGATDPLSTYGYRGVFRLLQTKTLPGDLSIAPKIATINPQQYNRTQFRQAINVKPGTEDLL